MKRFAKDSISVFCELSGCDKTKVGTAPTPFIDEFKDPLVITQEPKGSSAGAESSGELSPHRDDVLNGHSVARLVRPDWLRTVGASTTRIMKWIEGCGRRLFRVIKHMNGTTGWRQIGFIGDPASELQLGVFSGADFAGDRADMRSTSGVFLAPNGAHSIFPLMGQSKKQLPTARLKQRL